ncbi:MAG: biotin synthase BioB [Gammaproteobacteria bacterium RIFCSPHIGHO2_12_FULL_37_14]|nr:MAG: biotin synthase BioB [Gammaproteobacteria bacterium RIFCSPHIGHO2_12_FULL_37_14]
MARIWNQSEAEEIFSLPFIDLLFKAHNVHHQYFNVNEMELCTLLSIKTGSCPEDCAYCPQSAHYKTGLQKEKLFDLEEVKKHAEIAKQNGATRFCMGAAWRSPPKKDFPIVLEMIKAVKEIGLETCVTLGMLTEIQSAQLKESGLDFYNHNLDTSPAYYKKIITTRTYEQRLDTLEKVRNSGMKVCCGGIIGMGESRSDRIELLIQLANLPEPPTSVPINRLIPIGGTPLEQTDEIDNLEFIRTIAVARIMLPTSMIRLSAGRDSMSDEMQTLCFMAGANSIFFGEKLLTANNPDADNDLNLLKRLGMVIKNQPKSQLTCQ